VSATAAPATGLVLTGGGARAAYQVGVLKAVSRIRRECHVGRDNPFPIIVGTSAGAINAAALASHADHYDLAVAGLVDVWRHLTADQIYRADSFGVIRTGARWLTMLTLGWAIARWQRGRPRSLLDNLPLSALLERVIAVERVPQMLNDGHLQALAVSASSYSSGDHVTFYDAARPVEPWSRWQRVASPSHITIEHLLASSAIPFVFPATRLAMAGQREWFGDGSMRQAAPISPAIHLGAERILVVGAGRMQEPPGRRAASDDAPSLAQIAGHALSNIFLDALAVDVERLQRINRTLALLTEAQRAETPLKAIEVLLIAPSQRIDDLAAQHLGELPPPVRALLRAVGVSGQGSDARGAVLASYLLFEPGYIQALIDLGQADTLARRGEVIRFFGWERRRAERSTPYIVSSR
jgi:NTE family protein